MHETVNPINAAPSVLSKRGRVGIVDDGTDSDDMSPTTTCEPQLIRFEKGKESEGTKVLNGMVGRNREKVYTAPSPLLITKMRW